MPINHRYTAVENATPDELVDAAEWNDVHNFTPNTFSGNGVPAASYPAGQVRDGDYYINNSSSNASAAFYQKWQCVKVTNQGATDAIDWVAVNDGGNLQLTFDSNSGLTQPEAPIYADTGAVINIVGTPQIEFINSDGQSAGYAGHLKAGDTNITFAAQPNNTMQINAGNLSWQKNEVAQTGIVSTLNLGANIIGTFTAPGTLNVAAGTDGQGFGIPIQANASLFPTPGPFSYTAPYFQDLSTGVALGFVSFTVTFDTNINNYPSEFTSVWLTAINATTDAVPGHNLSHVDSSGRIYLTTSPPVHSNSLSKANIATAFNQTYSGSAGINAIVLQDPNIFGPFVNASNMSVGIVSAISVGGNTLTGNLSLTGGQSTNNISISNVGNSIIVETTQSPTFLYVRTLTPRVSSYTMNTTTVMYAQSNADTPLQFAGDFTTPGTLLARNTNITFSGFGGLVGDVFYNSSLIYDLYVNISGMVSWQRSSTGIRIVYIKRCTSTDATSTTWTTGSDAQRMYQSLVPAIPIPDLTYNTISCTIKLPSYTSSSDGYQGIVFFGWQTSGSYLNLGDAGSGDLLGYSTRLTFVEVV